jgi:pyruvyltransferase
MTNDIEAKTIEFLACEQIISSSLHGLIVAHAYGIPAVWQKFSNQVFGDDIKYQDYMESVGLPFYKPALKTLPFTTEEMQDLFLNLPSLPKKELLNVLCDGLMRVCPFKSN